jgi:adenylate kinase
VHMSKNIVITGMPGSGKGTQATLLASRLGIPHISTGDIFRDEMKRQTPLGISITESMNAGKYTSDEITNAVVKNRLAQPDAADGYILDGYPRTVNQVAFLDEIGVDITHVIDLHIDPDLALSRLLGRALEQARGDDTESVIRGRIDTYFKTVVPVLDIYKSRGLAEQVSAVGKIADINEELYTLLTK